MSDTTEQILSLLLHDDDANVFIGAQLLLQQPQPISDDRLKAAVAICSVLLPCTDEYSYRCKVSRKKDLPRHSALPKEEAALFAQLLKHTEQHFDDCLLNLYAFASGTSSEMPIYLERYEPLRELYEPLFVSSARWRSIYAALASKLYYDGYHRLCFPFFDAVLAVERDTQRAKYWAARRYNAVGRLLDKGEGQEEFEYLKKYTEYEIQHVSNSELCDAYNDMGNLYFYARYGNVDNDKAKEFYYKSIAAYDQYGGDEKMAALSANNTACIIHGRGDSSKNRKEELDEALRLIEYTLRLHPQNANYIDSLAHHQWKYMHDREAAKASFARVLKINPKHVATNAQLVRIHLEESALGLATLHLHTLLQHKVKDILFEKEHCAATFDAFEAYCSEQGVIDEKITDFLQRIAKMRKKMQEKTT